MATENKDEAQKQFHAEDTDSKRRKFIKGVLGGTAALGAASLMPSASALDVKDSKGFQVFDDTDTQYFDVNPGGPVEVKNADLNITTGSIVGRHLTNLNTVTSNYSTSGEQIIFADSSGGSLTVTLSSTDLLGGNEVVITDAGGSASTNNITVNTEGSANINGGSSITITSNYGAQRISSNGTNWYTSGGGSSSEGSGGGSSGISQKLYTRDPRR